MPFQNRIRLPFYLKQPQFPTEANRFRLANGNTKTLSVTIRKTFELVTDWMPDRMHQRFVIALNHDTVTIEGDKYVGGVAMDGDYEIQWIDFLDYPLGPATARIQVTPFDFTNDNCQTCEEATQLSLEDDTFPAPLAEGTGEDIDVFTNDSICCSPIEAEIMSFNTDFLDSATIDGDGIVSVVVKNPAPSGTNILLATYRVTCPNGAYDEANVYGDVTGSTPTCDDPVPVVDTISLPDMTFSMGFSGDFEWQLYTCEDLGTPVDTGTITGTEFLTLEDLVEGGCYQLSVRQDCGGSFSNWATLEFNVPLPVADACGRFLITANDGTLDPTVYSYSYMNCAGDIVNRSISNQSSQRICMLTDDANIPEYFVVVGPITYSYEIPCPVGG